MQHPLVKIVTLFLNEVHFTRPTVLCVAAAYLAKRETGLDATLEKLALCEAGCRTIDRDRVDFDDGMGWRASLFRDAPPMAWRLETDDGTIGAIVQCGDLADKATMSRYLIKDELAPDDPSVVL